MKQSFTIIVNRPVDQASRASLRQVRAILQDKIWTITPAGRDPWVARILACEFSLAPERSHSIELTTQPHGHATTWHWHYDADVVIVDTDTGRVEFSSRHASYSYQRVALTREVADCLSEFGIEATMPFLDEELQKRALAQQCTIKKVAWGFRQTLHRAWVHPFMEPVLLAVGSDRP